MVKHKAPWSEYYNSTPTPSPLNGLDGSLPPWTREVVKTSQRASQQELILIGEV